MKKRNDLIDVKSESRYKEARIETNDRQKTKQKKETKSKAKYLRMLTYWMIWREKKRRRRSERKSEII